jgi:two-component system chemotaxis sensor kinase CheA
MLRNSVDHGIEPPDLREEAGKPREGSIFLRARHQDNCIVIEIEDDGKGMDTAILRDKAVRKGVLTREAANRLTDREALNLIFAPGFTTVDVVSEVSGRGVGMDIVRSNLERVGATIQIDSEVGRGTLVTVRLPLTLAIIRALLVTVGGSVYAVPLSAVLETVRARSGEIHNVNFREVILHRGGAMPLVRLEQALPLQTVVWSGAEGAPVDTAGVVASHRSASPSPPELTVGGRPGPEIAAGDLRMDTSSADNSIYLVVVGQGEKRLGLAVDSLVGEQEVVIKTLGKFVGEIPGISGATILGDGRVALIVDVAGIMQIALAEKGKAYAA